MSFFVHEEPVVANFLALLQGQIFSLDNDQWIWKLAKDDHSQCPLHIMIC